jgi:hypothetical protein
VPVDRRRARRAERRAGPDPRPARRARADGIRAVPVAPVLAEHGLRAGLHPFDALAWSYPEPAMFEDYAEVNTARGYTVHGPYPGPAGTVIGVLDLRGGPGWTATDPATPDDGPPPPPVIPGADL